MAESAGGWLDDVTFWVDGEPSVADGVQNAVGGGAGSPGAAGEVGTVGGGLPAGGKGFSFSRDEAEAVLQKFRQVVEGLKRTQRDADQLKFMQPAADDPASVRFNDAAVEAFERGAEFVQREVLTYEELVTRLEKALGAYQQADESAAGQAGGAGGAADSDKGAME